MSRASLRWIGHGPAIALAITWGVPATADEAANIQDRILVSGAEPAGPDVEESTAAIEGVSGRLAVNLAAGDGNQQLSSATIAIGDVAVGVGVAVQAIDGADLRDRRTHIALEGDAFAETSGMLSLNIAAGIQNQSANLAVLTIGSHGVLSDALLAQSRAPIEPNGSTGGAESRNDVVEISDQAFRNSSGLIQINLIGGERNSSANTFVLSVLDEGFP